MREKSLYLDLAGIRVKVLHDDALSNDPGILAGYLAEPGGADCTCRVELVESLPIAGGECLYDSGGQRVSLEAAGVCRSFFEGGHAYLRVFRGESENRIQYSRHCRCREITPRLLLHGLELEHLLTVHHGILLHASFIAHDGRAILFTAPSETGKSTQARLWCDHAGAELVNGDRAAVRIFDDGVKACGIPFAGSSGVRRNECLPLAAIVCLSQAPENTVTRLRGVRAFRRIWEGCTVNIWDREDVELATETVTGILSRIPVYHLACTPDIRAVELLRRTMEEEI